MGGGGDPFHRRGGVISTVGMQEPASLALVSGGGDLMICNICVNIFGGSWGGGGGGGPLFSL